MSLSGRCFLRLCRRRQDVASYVSTWVIVSSGPLEFARSKRESSPRRHARLNRFLAANSQAEVAGPVIRHDFPLAVRLPAKQYQILPSLLASFAHGDGNQ